MSSCSYRRDLEWVVNHTVAYFEFRTMYYQIPLFLLKFDLETWKAFLKFFSFSIIFLLSTLSRVFLYWVFCFSLDFLSVLNARCVFPDSFVSAWRTILSQGRILGGLWYWVGWLGGELSALLHVGILHLLNHP